MFTICCCCQSRALRDTIKKKKKPVGRHHAYTHPGERTEYEERGREFDVMPDVEQIGKRWENTAIFLFFCFFSILAIQFSSAEPDIRTLHRILTLRQPHFSIISKKKKKTPTNLPITNVHFLSVNAC